MDTIVILQIFLIQTHLHEQWKHVLTVQCITEDIECLLELRGTYIGSYMLSALLLIR